MIINKNHYYLIIILYYIKKIIKYYYLFLFLSAYIFYFLSLEKCKEGFDLCSLKTKWIQKKAYESLISIFILVLLIELIFYKIISSLNLLHLLLYYVFTLIYSHGIDFEDHGYYNFIGNIALIIIILSIISPLNCLLYL